MNKREAFWQSIYPEDGSTAPWPSTPEEGAKLASKMVGAAAGGAAEHILGQSLRRLAGGRPEPGANDYAVRLKDAEVLSTLSDEQREVLTRLVHETAYFALYWPLVKMRDPGEVSIRLVAVREPEDAPTERYDLTEFLEPHQLLLQWITLFGENLEPARAPE